MCCTYPNCIGMTRLLRIFCASNAPFFIYVSVFLCDERRQRVVDV